MELSRREILRYAGCRGSLESAPAELRTRLEELLAEAPIAPRSVWRREGETLFLVGTIGVEFDRWQRRLALTGAADSLLVQAIGAAAVEEVMDAVEREAKTAQGDERDAFGPRRSPGYGELPLSLSEEILRRTGAARAIGVHCTSDYLLVPTKSVTALCRKK